MKRFHPMPSLLALLMAAALSAPVPASAGPGHDHGDAPPTPTGNGPSRQPDGSVFLPKPAQRQLGVRTVVGAMGQHAKAFELAGTVVMDPNAGGKVQAVLAGRLEAGPKGLPGVGQAVRKGEVLAYEVPTAGAIERSNQLAQQAELRAARDLAARRVARLAELADTGATSASRVARPAPTAPRRWVRLCSSLSAASMSLRGTVSASSVRRATRRAARSRAARAAALSGRGAQPA